MQRVTLKILAKKLGLSVATVSKALKNYPDINKETKLRVLELVKTLNYKPNSFAQSLRNQESRIIGLIIPDIVHHFFSNIIKGVITSAEEKGYLVVVLQSDESYEHEVELLQLLISKNVDGILLSLSGKTIRFNHIHKIIANGTPFVLYDKISKSVNCSKVLIDDTKAAYNATEHLIKTGCQKIAHISGQQKPQTTIDRLKGYKKALAEYNIPFTSSLVYTSENLTYQDGYNLALKIVNDHPDIDGIFTLTDLIASGVLNKLKEMKITVPNKISVIGFSNWFISEITTPKLTTINQPGFEMGRTAFKQLFEEITALKNKVSIEPKIITLETTLIKRESTRNL